MPQAILPFGRYTQASQPVLWDPPPFHDIPRLRQIIEANAVCGRIVIEQRVPRDPWSISDETHETVAIIIPATVKAIRDAEEGCRVTRIVPDPQRADFERALEPARVGLSMAAVCASKRADFRRLWTLNPWAFGRE